MKKLVYLLAAAALLAVPALAIAGVGGTLHDMDAYKSYTTASGGGTCAYCHVPHGAAGAKLFPATGATGTLAWLADTNKVTPRLCETCHNASSAYLKANTFTDAPFNDNAHGDNTAKLNWWGDNTTANIKAANVRLDNNDHLECTACHDVHNAVTRPFMAYVATTGELHQNCLKCHGGRANDGALLGSANAVTAVSGTTPGAVNSSQHPTSMAYSGTTYGENWAGSIDGAFSTAAVTSSGASSAATYSRSGKLKTDGTIGCQTCHAVHGAGTKTAPAFYNGTNGTPAVLARVSSPTAATSAFCEGCHAVSPTITTANTHPVDTPSTAWTVNVNIPGLPYVWTWGSSGGADVIVCNTCHDVHYGSPNTAVVRRKASNNQIDNTQATAYSQQLGDFCNECHGGTTGRVASFRHHPVGWYLDNATVLPIVYNTNIYQDSANTLLYSSADNVNWNTRGRTGTTGNQYAFAVNPTFGGSARTGNFMTCGNCHGAGGSGTSKAHGVSTTGIGYALRANDDDQLCVDCHSFNPSDFLKTTRTAYDVNQTGTTHTMTHYVGPVVTSGYKRATNTTWPVTGVASKYSLDNTAGAVICQSCHYWKAGNQLALNTSGRVTGGPVRAWVAGLIAPSGNDQEPTTVNDYLCTGCHGTGVRAASGSGQHPTRPTMTVSSSAGITASVAGNPNTIAGGHATLTPGNASVNCDSCHRPHNATLGTGALILESQTTDPVSNKPAFQLASDNGTGNNQFLNQEGLCTRCHTQGQ